MKTKILAVDDNEVNLKLISATLKQGGYETITAQNGPEALKITASDKPSLILLDISMPDMDGYEVCKRIRDNKATSRIPIIMLTAHDTLEEKMKGYEVGADDYITKPFQPVELLARINVLLRRVAIEIPAKSSIPNKSISVFSLKGGVGISSISTNMAVGLAQIWNAPVALLDMSFTLGQSALLLNLPMRNSWADLANVPANEIDNEVLDGVLMQHESGVSVLAAPGKPSEAETITSDNVEAVINILKEKFSYIIFDLPHNFNETTLDGLDNSDEIVLVLTPELASVKATVSALDVFDELGYSRDKVKLLINWTFARRGLARKDIEHVLKHPIDYIIPFASEVFVTAVNIGEPPVYKDPSSPIGILFEDMSFDLSKDDDRNKKPQEPSDAWLRLTKREKQKR